MVLGVIMTLIILKPIIGTETFDLEAYLQNFQGNRELAVEDGINYA